MEDMFRLCFNKMELTMSDVPKSKDDTKCAALLASLKAETPVINAILPPIRDIVDNAFSEHLGPATPVSHVFAKINEATWLIAFSEYADQVVSSVSETVKELVTSGELSKMGLSSDTVTAVKSCAPKMRLVLGMGGWNTENSGIMPFMCRSVYAHMEGLLANIPNALKEVSWLMVYFAHFDNYTICATSYTKSLPMHTLTVVLFYCRFRCGSAHILHTRNTTHLLGTLDPTQLNSDVPSLHTRT